MDDYSALFILSYFFSAPLIQVTKACFDFVAHLAKGLELLNSVLLAILNTNVNKQQHNIVFLHLQPKLPKIFLPLAWCALESHQK